MTAFHNSVYCLRVHCSADGLGRGNLFVRFRPLLMNLAEEIHAICLT